MFLLLLLYTFNQGLLDLLLPLQVRWWHIVIISTFINSSFLNFFRQFHLFLPLSLLIFQKLDPIIKNELSKFVMCISSPPLEKCKCVLVFASF